MVTHGTRTEVYKEREREREREGERKGNWNQLISIHKILHTTNYRRCFVPTLSTKSHTLHKFPRVSLLFFATKHCFYLKLTGKWAAAGRLAQTHLAQIRGTDWDHQQTVDRRDWRTSPVRSRSQVWSQRPGNDAWTTRYVTQVVTNNRF